MSGLEPILLIGGTILSVVGSVTQGIHQQALGKRQAELKEQQAGQERAQAQREAIEQRRLGRFVSSRIQAVSAASGAGALDPTIVNILGEVGSEVEIRALTALASGEQRALDLEFGAELDRAGGKGEAISSFFSAGGTLLEGGTSFFNKFGNPFSSLPGNPFSRAPIPPVGRRNPRGPFGFG